MFAPTRRKMNTNYIMRHGPKVSKFDKSGLDKNGIDAVKTKELLLASNVFDNTVQIQASTMLRTQLTAKIAHEIHTVPLSTSVELSPYTENSFYAPNGSKVTDNAFVDEQRHEVNGPIESRDHLYFLLPMLGSSQLTTLLPNISELSEWEAIKAIANFNSEQIKPFWTYSNLGQRASDYLSANSQKDTLAISHSGIIEPMIAQGLGRSFDYVADFIGETQWGFCESAKLTYDGEGLVKVNFRDESIRRK